jgi:hypothetical protein
MYDLVDIMGHPWVDNSDSSAFVRGYQLVSLGIFPLDLTSISIIGGSNDSTRTGDDQDDASLD